MPKKHGLGVGNGKLIEYEDGTVGYIQTGQFTQAFRVKIADVTGFSVVKAGKILTREVNVLGNGTLLGTAEVNHGTAELIEKWFRAHPDFGRDTSAEVLNQVAPPPTIARSADPPAAAPSSALVADELRKLADLRSEGILSDEEFNAQKQRLLAS